jgi:hypothetical protein
VIVNWYVCYRINQEIQKNKMAEYGQTIVASLAQQLQIKYGRGFDKTSNMSNNSNSAEGINHWEESCKLFCENRLNN